MSSIEDNEVEVLIIGAGASGAAVAWSLASSGIEVLCLEQGGWTDPKDYASAHDDWELRAANISNPQPNVRNLPSDYPVNDKDSPIAPLMYNAVGGSTIFWSAHFPRFHPSDFKVKSLDGVADDWPISYRQLEPYFDKNDEIMGVSGLDGDPAYPPKSPRQMPPFPLGKGGEKLVDGFNKLGWHWWPSDAAINNSKYDGRAACNYCGPCNTGCYLGAKASTDITYWPKAISLGAKIVTNARVRELIVGKDGLVKGALYYDENGNLQQQNAKLVVVACNGVGTPRLLLNSSSSMFPDGLANSSGLVGKNLMFHPYAAVTGFFDEFVDGYMGPQGISIISQEFYETDLSRGFVRGYSFQATAKGPGPRGAANSGGMATGQASYIAWGEGHHDVFESKYGRTATIVVIGEDLPEEINTVTLDPELTDGDGIPAPKITYRMSENSLNMMDHGVKKAEELLNASGAIRITNNPLLRVAGWHLMGTARMGLDPSKSVVNEKGQAHDVKNLFIVDGSVFVTGAAVNPTSTIQAVALYIADQIKKVVTHL